MIRKIMLDNLVETIDFNSSLVGYFLGSSGKTIRQEIDEIKCKFDMPKANPKIMKLRGSREQIDQTKAKIATWVEQNFMDEFEVDDDDMRVLLTGGKNSFVQTLEEKSDNLSIGVQKNNNSIRLKGPKAVVISARGEIEILLNGGEGRVVEDLQVDENSRGEMRRCL